mmetsp:Transcript_11341/g.23038  ORF Transcript_11341/g.23038 Transcript_11341/m.23038 type:complete len:209 (-) Transcript_11341:152-778(-)
MAPRGIRMATVATGQVHRVASSAVGCTNATRSSTRSEPVPVFRWPRGMWSSRGPSRGPRVTSRRSRGASSAAPSRRARRASRIRTTPTSRASPVASSAPTRTRRPQACATSATLMPPRSRAESSARRPISCARALAAPALRARARAFTARSGQPWRSGYARRSVAHACTAGSWSTAHEVMSSCLTLNREAGCWRIVCRLIIADLPLFV